MLRRFQPRPLLVSFPYRSFSAASSRESSYLHSTLIPTSHFQESLPKLEIPPLEETVSRYLASVKPLADEASYKETEKKCETFMNGIGKDLQSELIANDAAKYSSFISEPWFDMYFKARTPLPLNWNPFLMFKDDPSKPDQLSRAASLLHSSVIFYRTLRDGHLKPDIFPMGKDYRDDSTFATLVKMTPEVQIMGKHLRGVVAYMYDSFPLDMSQYNGLFSSTRIPKQGKDELKKFSQKDSSHVIVQFKNKFFKVKVLHDDGTGYSQSDIYSQLHSITTSEENESQSVGILTSQDRDVWAKDRELLINTSEQNAKALNEVDSALFALCLEDKELESDEDAMRGFLHGDGRNRWFDKSFQLIVTPTGRAALNFEHSWGDGVAVLRYFNETFNHSMDNPSEKATDGPTCEEVVFDTSSEQLQSSIAKASEDLDKFIDSIDLVTVQVNDEVKLPETETIVSKKFLKKCKLKEADGFMQVSFQLAHYLMYGYHASTYESANQSHYKHGRTETIRSCTTDSAAFCEAVGDELSDEAVAQLMRKACKTHAENTRNAMTGKGWDRHLFALRHLAEKKGLEPLDIFTDENYAKQSEIILSTSTLSSEALESGGFGPVGDKCYGIGYEFNNEGCRFSIMSYKRNTAEFGKSLQKALTIMAKLAEIKVPSEK